MKKFALITGILILCIASAFVCGCMSTPVIQPAIPTPTATPITTSIATPTMTTVSTPAPIVKVYNESINGTTVSMPLSSRFSVILLENPTTGYSWNVTVTDGLLITKATFTPPQSGLDGAGGSHTWDVLTIKTGQQKFSGIYKQPWMNATKNDTLFTLGVNVTCSPLTIPFSHTIWDSMACRRQPRRAAHAGDIGYMYTTTFIVTARYTITMPDARELFDKARELAEEDHYQEVLALLDQGIRIDANNANAWYNKGFILFKMGRYQDALFAFAQATDIDPEFDQAWYNKGVALLRLRKYPEAIRAFDKALKLNPRDQEEWCQRDLALKAIISSAESSRPSLKDKKKLF